MYNEVTRSGDTSDTSDRSDNGLCRLRPSLGNDSGLDFQVHPEARPAVAGVCLAVCSARLRLSSFGLYLIRGHCFTSLVYFRPLLPDAARRSATGSRVFCVLVILRLLSVRIAILHPTLHECSRLLSFVRPVRNLPVSDFPRDPGQDADRGCDAPRSPVAWRSLISLCDR